MLGWKELNERQQKCLQAIYDQDQENEREERASWLKNRKSRPAVEWRWMFFGRFLDTGNDSPLRHRLSVAGLVDPDTDSTLKVLEERGCILRGTRPMAIGDPLHFVQITPRGRKLVRRATGEQREKPLPVGTLRERHWRAMAETWKVRPHGVMEGAWYLDYGWDTGCRLRDYRAGALIEEYSLSQYSAKSGYTSNRWIRLSPRGEQFYRDNWQRYRELYPDVDAPTPTLADAAPILPAPDRPS